MTPPARRGHPGAAPVAVLGAGPSGLATAAMLRRTGIPVVVLERADRVGASWARHYDHLRLHTPRGASRLPGLPLPRRSGPWVSREEFVRYLERYREYHGLDVRTGVTAHRIEPAPAVPGARWRVRTSDGPLVARAVVVATGRCRSAYLPEWPGREGFTGTLLHTADYRGPRPFKGSSVLVVGAGNSGTEIASVLAREGARRTWLAVRTPPTILPRSSSRWHAAGRLTELLPPSWNDRPALFVQRLTVPDLSAFGVPPAPTGPFTRHAREEVTPVLDHGFVAAVRSGAVRPVAAVAGFDGPRVELADGGRLTADVVIAATGYRPCLEGLVAGLDVLDAAGYPRVRGSRTCATAPLLYFAGFTNPLGGALRQVCVEARGIARSIAARTGRPSARRWRVDMS
ncbi:NAD(P)/FAD-dependent oxidoreductase [Streptomyces mobaraensis]|uniref:flavin-containing monooxygenase n=1 Tax=Streptomyces mobaraensis TaxID=35621 RepID=UPI003332C1BD